MLIYRKINLHMVLSLSISKISYLYVCSIAAKSPYVRKAVNQDLSQHIPDGTLVYLQYIPVCSFSLFHIYFTLLLEAASPIHNEAVSLLLNTSFSSIA